MICPNCGQEAEFAEHAAVSMEPHGESFSDSWLTCKSCGAPTDDAELRAANPEVQEALEAA
jgi:C4-type Zn-finger protein